MLILQRSIFFMVPRTGTTWVREAIKRALPDGQRPFKEFGPKHSTRMPESGEEKKMFPSVPTFRFCFVREPRAWVRSRWTLGPWDDELTGFWSANMLEFCERVSDPMVEMYFAKWTKQCQFVGHVETLADDLVTVLRQSGEKINEPMLRSTPRQNWTDWETQEFVHERPWPPLPHPQDQPLRVMRTPFKTVWQERVYS